MRTLHWHWPPIDEFLEALVLYVIVVPIIIGCIVTALIFILD